MCIYLLDSTLPVRKGRDILGNSQSGNHVDETTDTSTMWVHYFKLRFTAGVVHSMPSGIRFIRSWTAFLHTVTRFH